MSKSCLLLQPWHSLLSELFPALASWKTWRTRPLARHWLPARYILSCFSAGNEVTWPAYKRRVGDRFDKENLAVRCNYLKRRLLLGLLCRFVFRMLLDCSQSLSKDMNMMRSTVWGQRLHSTGEDLTTFDHLFTVKCVQLAGKKKSISVV